MIERTWQWLKLFLNDHARHSTIEHLLLILFLLGAIAAVIMGAILFYRTNKEIKQLDTDKRKRDKQILKFLSEKKNRTY